jgi:hypothetical protein
MNLSKNFYALVDGTIGEIATSNQDILFYHNNQKKANGIPHFSSFKYYTKVSISEFFSDEGWLISDNVTEVNVEFVRTNIFYKIAKVVAKVGESTDDIYLINERVAIPNPRITLNDTINESGGIMINGKQSMKVSKFLHMIKHNFSHDNPKLLDRAVELMAEQFKKRTMTIQIEYDVEKVYASDRGCRLGTLGGSCMNADNTDYYGRKFVSMYDDIGANILTARDEDGLLIGRAILWEINSDSGDFTFMDRVYGAEDTIFRMIETAKINGWAYKYEQSYDSQRIILPNGDIITEFSADASGCKEDGNPYLDTLYNYYEGVLYSYDVRGSIYLQNTEGNAWGNHCCANCGADLGSDDCIREIDGEIYCDGCAVYSEYHEEALILDDDVVYVDEHGYVKIEVAQLVHGKWYLERDLIYSEKEGEWFHQYDDDWVESEDEGWIKYDNSVEINGDYYHVDNVSYSDVEEKYFPDSEEGWVDSLEGWIKEEDAVEVDGQIRHKDYV